MKTLHEKGIHQPGVLDLRPLMELVRVLREPGGCPWDRVQTHQSMRRELVEEVYEMLEAIDDGNVAGMREEMAKPVRSSTSFIVILCPPFEQLYFT